MRIATMLVLMLSTTVAHADDCGEERADVKLGLDRDARKIPLNPVDATIAELVLRSQPKLPRRGRATDERNTERTVYKMTVTVTGYKLEADGDYHVVVADHHGQTMIVELSDPGCAALGAWASQIRESGAAFRRMLADHELPSPSKKLHKVHMSVDVTGVGFFDRVHGQDGVAKNGVELHPVLSIETTR